MVRANSETSVPNWLSLIDASGESSLGGALVRLARKAAEMHAAELAAKEAEIAEPCAEMPNGLGSSAGEVRKEVDR